MQSENITPADLLAPGTLAQRSPPGVSNPSDNLKNLFEIPVLFYAIALYLFVTSQLANNYITGFLRGTGRVDAIGATSAVAR